MKMGARTPNCRTFLLFRGVFLLSRDGRTGWTDGRAGERTRADERTDRRTDGRTDGNMDSTYW